MLKIFLYRRIGNVSSYIYTIYRGLKRKKCSELFFISRFFSILWLKLTFAGWRTRIKTSPLSKLRESATWISTRCQPSESPFKKSCCNNRQKRWFHVFVSPLFPMQCTFFSCSGRCHELLARKNTCLSTATTAAATTQSPSPPLPLFFPFQLLCVEVKEE